MDGQKSQAKLTRTQSSLLRSSPTIRSSIHSLSSINEDEMIASQEEEKKPHRSGSTPRTGSHRFASVLAMASLTFSRFSKSNAKPVQWFIGESTTNKVQKAKRIVREGVEFYSNGDFYEGEFHKGRCNGSGVYNYIVNGRYEGDWIDGRYDGYGIESWARGSRYRGQYRQGLRHGYGVYRFYTGDSYAGEWVNGQSHGIGVQTCSDGSCYVGEFKCGVKHGLGCYHFRNGDRYAGEYFGDKIHGFGVYHFANGHCYEGSWHEGRKQGYGMYSFRNGDTRCGEWDSGTLKNPLPPLTDAVLRAVQAARRTAENAIHVPRVDEQVNKAVTAANRAATAARVAAVKAVQNRMDGKFCETTDV
ncbi:Phosphatidylinositol 4-phosphate 5-kinase 1 [Vitis vinifera]|uniref:Phosphatidylinositol 4-phosphate 5-kinase 1 n=1 Tax=Vitis vinifera TaxID=29760 RepID=A0A438C450_VITVI|nr:Phosphatidylinositol 4-phosphate 5-kinase 1 [Vitis vinifera]